jgi:hypothetical protein
MVYLIQVIIIDSQGEFYYTQLKAKSEFLSIHIRRDFFIVLRQRVYTKHYE